MADLFVMAVLFLISCAIVCLCVWFVYMLIKFIIVFPKAVVEVIQDEKKIRNEMKKLGYTDRTKYDEYVKEQERKKQEEKRRREPAYKMSEFGYY